MKTTIIALAALFFPIIVFCQDITGLWTGTMYNDVTKKYLPYEVFISKDKGKYTGYSKTIFSIAGDQYYGIKKMKVDIAKDGKIILLDAGMIKNDYPIENKNVRQLNVLDFVSKADETELNGIFVTNQTRIYAEVTGKVNLKRVSAYGESSLMQYLQINNSDKDISAVK